MTWDTDLLFTTSGCWQQRCSNHRECSSMSALHRVHTEFAKIGRPSSHWSLCRPRVPFTPLSRAMSHSYLQDVVCATSATNLAFLCERPCVVSNSKSLSIRIDFCSATITEVSQGSFRHLTSTLVPRDDSSMRHCCIIDTLYTSTAANDENISLLISSTSLELDSSLERSVSFRISTLVDIEGHWRANLTVVPEKCFGSWRILRPISF